MKAFKPTKEDLADAVNRKVPDVISPGLKVLFTGINPGIYTAAVRRHFAHPANRFWKALCDGGFTPRLLSPFENEELLKYGYGITNIVRRPTLRADELSREELLEGWRVLERKVKRYQPAWVAVCGLDAYRKAFNKKAQIGKQEEKLFSSGLWVLPNPSGLNANFTPDRLAKVFSELKKAAG